MWVKTTKWVTVDDLCLELWSGARDRWMNATDEQREEAFSRLEDYFDQACADDGEENAVEMVTVNDELWFDMDDIWDGEDDEDDDEDDEDDDEDEETEGEMKAVNTILIGRISGEFKLQPDGYWENTIVHTTVNNGEETVHFVTVRFRGKQAELAYTHLSKGDLCCIEGRRGEETTDTGVVKQYIEAGHITFLATGRRNND